MAQLHSLCICHGGLYSNRPNINRYLLTLWLEDFRPANILARISGLDAMSEVVTLSGDAHHLDMSPRYVVYPVSWDKVVSGPKGASLVDEKACVIDFGESFEVSAPTPDLGIPQVYCSPEYTLEGTVGIECDIWALRHFRRRQR
jgi:hypothetical protein